jgi:hypothetical protein
MRERGLTKVKMKAIDPQKFFAPQKIIKVPRAYESLNPGLDVIKTGLNILMPTGSTKTGPE